MTMKSTDRLYLSRVLERDYVFEKVSDPDFEGLISLFVMKTVSGIKEFTYDESTLRVIDEGHQLVQYLPKDRCFSATAFLDKNGCLLQWYVDILSEPGRLEDGIPVYEDLYLDIIVVPHGKCYLIDQEDLILAEKSGVITAELAMKANLEAEQLLERFEKNGVPYEKRLCADLEKLRKTLPNK